MKLFFTLILCVCSAVLASQQVIELPHEPIEGVTWIHKEKSYYSDIWQTDVVTNVSNPSMQVFQPEASIRTGTAVIIAPGGALYAHSINSEGNWVAEWLVKKGITAFVLKYRLVPTGKDGVAEISKIWAEHPEKMEAQVAKILPFSVQDGLNAVAHVRENADLYDIQPDKIGFMGFSAGGAVTMGVSYRYNATNRPDFIVPIYTWTSALPVQPIKSNAPPALIICATDDPLGLAKGSIAIYNSYLKMEKTVGLHMYAKGGHGFGMRKQNLPADSWIERFYEWAVAESLIKTSLK
ncbi:alpha/beta hydrolase [Croceitalea dokdonensis]|uniref:alpha/beta hydrolase n=1 Tax=Croceitalea dokdonensis TaxID=346188 RepID=UPI0006CA3CCA|nr:alpha/beta hydrolase [Croceitalea dokdonensis]